MSLKIVLMGTGEFALPPFKALMESDKHEVVGVYTQPDKTGRGHHRHVNKVKELAISHGIAVFQPPKVNTPESLAELSGLGADLFVVAAYGQIMKPELLAIPRLGAFNLHGSLLPRHRGAAPVQYSIWKGDSSAGVTIFQIEPSLDSGPMIGKVATEIGPKETSGELMLRLADLSVDLTLTAVDQLDSGSAIFEKQDETLVTLASKIQKADGIITWDAPSSAVDCHVRAMQPWPKAVTVLHCEGRKPTRCIIVDVDVVESDGQTGVPGTIDTSEKSLKVATADGWVLVNKIQPEGKKPMDGKALVNGYGLGKGARFGSEA